MQVNTCIKELAAGVGVSLSELSRRLGRSRVYVSNVGAPTRSPALATVADVADAAGVDVVLVERSTGRTLGTIEPPRKAAGDPVEG